MNIHRSLVLLLCAAVLSGCEKNAVQDITGPLPSARVKFFHFGVNAPGVNFYANETKVTAISSADTVESTNGVNYGGVGAGSYYSAIAPGQYTFTARIAAATDKNVPISSATATIADGKNYTFYMSGFYDATTKQADAFVVEDVYPAQIDFSAAYVRFVHAMSNANPMAMYVTSTGDAPTETPIGGVVAYKTGGAFVAIPGGLYNLSTRYDGMSTNAISRTGVTFAAGRVYTITARGDITVTSTTATDRPFLDNTANR